LAAKIITALEFLVKCAGYEILPDAFQKSRLIAEEFPGKSV
jgi:hypothetical protein